jgi:hypothetical protein
MPISSHPHTRTPARTHTHTHAHATSSHPPSPLTRPALSSPPPISLSPSSFDLKGTNALRFNLASLIKAGGQKRARQ